MRTVSTASISISRRLRQAAAHLTARIVTPFVHRWIRRQEAHICRRGRPLNAAALYFAHRIGIAEPERVRTLTVASIPLPAQRLAKVVARFSHVILTGPVALTAGRGIYVQAGLGDDQTMLRHELVHVRQYERYGSQAFLKRYVIECLVEGYTGAPLEKEARRISTSIDDVGPHAGRSTLFNEKNGGNLPFDG